MSSKIQLYGFEDLVVYRVMTSVFDSDDTYSYPRSFYVYDFNRGESNLLPVDKESLGKTYGDLSVSIEQHPELLSTAKKLYIHPSCAIPRDIVAKKYKRCLNPYVADAVIIPSASNKQIDTHENCAVFANDTYALIALFYENYHSSTGFTPNPAYINMNNAPAGTPIMDFIPKISKDQVPNKYKDAKLVYTGPLASFNKNDKAIFDYLTYVIPQDKIVFQEELMKTLNDETNVPTFDGLVSIYDMLCSSDEEVVEVGLKALAALDYTHYPNAIKTVLRSGSNWRYNSAVSSVAVKYMLRTFGIKNTGQYLGYTNRFITKEDYDLTEKLIKHCNNLDDKGYVEYCYGLSFVYIDSENKVIPRIKEEKAK